MNVQYAVKHGLVKASDEDVDNYLVKFKSQNEEQDWDIAQRRAEKALEHSKQEKEKERKNRIDTQTKTGRKWILPKEYNAFMSGIHEAIRLEEDRIEHNEDPGPFYQMLKYIPCASDGGLFAVNKLWWRDMCRILFGLDGPIGDKMREAELSVYNGEPFAAVTGRKKIKNSKKHPDYSVIGAYWRDKIKDETTSIKKENTEQLKFLFSQADMNYYVNHL